MSIINRAIDAVLENKRLRAQVVELQRAGTAAIEERRANDLTYQVTEFRRLFGITVRSKPEVPPTAELAMCLRLVVEEFVEVLGAAGAPLQLRELVTCRLTEWIDWQAGAHGFPCEDPGFNVGLVHLAHELADLDFVVEGLRLSCGLPRQAVANEIARANLAKAGGPRDANGKIRKPPGWTPPDVAGVMGMAR
jgi:predicted HAD superfamily Cof-like phosphohydrolase